MKKKEFEKMKSASLEDLKKEVVELKRKFTVVSAKIQAGKEKNLKAAKLTRVRIAKLSTLISQKEKEPKVESKPAKAKKEVK